MALVEINWKKTFQWISHFFGPKFRIIFCFQFSFLFFDFHWPLTHAETTSTKNCNLMRTIYWVATFYLVYVFHFVFLLHIYYFDLFDCQLLEHIAWQTIFIYSLDNLKSCKCNAYPCWLGTIMFNDENDM